MSRDSAAGIATDYWLYIFILSFSFILDYLRCVNASRFCLKRTLYFYMCILSDLCAGAFADSQEPKIFSKMLCCNHAVSITSVCFHRRKIRKTDSSCRCLCFFLPDPVSQNSSEVSFILSNSLPASWQTQTKITHVITLYFACFFQQRLNCQFRGFPLQNSLL